MKLAPALAALALILLAPAATAVPYPVAPHASVAVTYRVYAQFIGSGDWTPLTTYTDKAQGVLAACEGFAPNMRAIQLRASTGTIVYSSTTKNCQ